MRHRREVLWTRGLLVLLGVMVVAGGALAVRPAAAQPAPAAGAGTITGTVSTRPNRWKVGVVVHVVSAPGTFTPPATPPTYNQRGLAFLPHVMPVLRGTPVRFSNSDNVRHHVFSPDGERYDLGTWPQTETRTYTFRRSGVYRQLCNIHPEMLGYIVVLDNPFYAVTDENGHYTITGVPAGQYTLRAWSEGEGLQPVTQPVTVTAGGSATVDFSLRRQ